MLNIIPKASRWEVHFCGHCNNPHLIFFDEKNLPICDATMSPEQIDMLHIHHGSGAKK